MIRTACIALVVTGVLGIILVALDAAAVRRRLRCIEKQQSKIPNRRGDA